MSQPPGFVNSHFPDYVCNLHKVLYSLKQAPRAWYNALMNFLIIYGFLNYQSVTSLFIYNRDGVALYILVYVDDLLLTQEITTDFLCIQDCPCIKVLSKGSQFSSSLPWHGNHPYISRFVSFTAALCTWSSY